MELAQLLRRLKTIACSLGERAPEALLYPPEPPSTPLPIIALRSTTSALDRCALLNTVGCIFWQEGGGRLTLSSSPFRDDWSIWCTSALHLSRIGWPSCNMHRPAWDPRSVFLTSPSLQPVTCVPPPLLRPCGGHAPPHNCVFCVSITTTEQILGFKILGTSMVGLDPELTSIVHYGLKKK